MLSMAQERLEKVHSHLVAVHVMGREGEGAAEQQVELVVFELHGRGGVCEAMGVLLVDALHRRLLEHLELGTDELNLFIIL